MNQITRTALDKARQAGFIRPTLVRDRVIVAVALVATVASVFVVPGVTGQIVFYALGATTWVYALVSLTVVPGKAMIDRNSTPESRARLTRTWKTLVAVEVVVTAIAGFLAELWFYLAGSDSEGTRPWVWYSVVALGLVVATVVAVNNAFSEIVSAMIMRATMSTAELKALAKKTATPDNDIDQRTRANLSRRFQSIGQLEAKQNKLDQLQNTSGK